MAWRVLRASLKQDSVSISSISSSSSSSISSSRSGRRSLQFGVCEVWSRSTTKVAAPLQDFDAVNEPVVDHHEFKKLNGELLYSRMTTPELLKALLNLHLIASGPLVDVGIKVLKSPLVMNKFSSGPIYWAIKNTIYSHFCAGENTIEATRTLERLWQLRLRGVLDYGLEDALDNRACDDNLKQFLATIYRIRSLPQESVSYACVKITAIAPLSLLERISLLLRWQHRDPTMDLPWKKPGLPIFAPESPTYHAQSKPEHLTPSEEHDLVLAQARLAQLCSACDEENLPLLVDAEYTSVQPAIDYITYAATEQFNKRRSKPLVYATIQAYLKDSYTRLQLVAETAAERGIPFGVKLVRGAYLSRETELARSVGVPSPVHPCIEETHRCYDKCAEFMLEKAAAGRGSIVLATHNFDSGKVATLKAEELGIKKGDPRLHFAQLKGMADGLSLSLVRAGFQVSKYLPFGPVPQMLKYLTRRAEENRGLLGNTKEDRQWIRREILRRWFG